MYRVLEYERKDDMMIKPLLDRVVLEKIEPEKKTASGIILSEASKDKPVMAKVVAVGEGKYESGQLIPVSVAVDDTVIYRQYAGTEVKFEGKEYLIVESKDILAIVK